MTISENWDLESIFEGGSQSATLADFLDTLTTDLTDFEATSVPTPLAEEVQPVWVDKIQTLYELGARLRQAGSFIECLISQDVKDDKALQLTAQVDQLGARLGNLWTQLSALFAQQDDAAWDKLLAASPLEAISFHLNEERNLAREKMKPELETLANELAVPMSIDTTKSEVAQMALEAGARMLNDQWGLKGNPQLAKLAAEWKVPIVLMSNQRDKGGYDAVLKRDTADYDDPINEIISSLKGSLKIAAEAGVPEENIIIDPGIGFGKSWQHDLEIVRRLDELDCLGRPILLGPSGKSFIGKVLDLPVSERLQGTAAAVAIGIAHGADMVRVHDVKQIVRVCRMSDAIVRRRQIGN